MEIQTNHNELRLWGGLVYEYEKNYINNFWSGLIAPGLYLFHSLLLVMLDLYTKSHFKEASNDLLFDLPYRQVLMIIQDFQ